MSFLDNLLLAIRTITVGGNAVTLPAGTNQPTILNFINGTVVYNTITKAWDVNFLGPQTTMQFSSGALVVGGVAGLSSSASTAQNAFSFPVANGSVQDWTVTVVGRNAGGNGDAFRSDLFETIQSYSGVAVVVGAGASPANTRSNGAGSSYTCGMSTAGSNVYVNVTNPGSVLTDWCVIYQVQECL